MAIQQQINHGTIQKVCYLHNGIFIPFTCVTLCQIYSFVSPILFTKNNKLWNEIKEVFFVDMATSGYYFLLKKVENRILYNRICINKQFILTKQVELSRIFMQIFHSHLRYTGSWVCFSYCSL